MLYSKETTRPIEQVLKRLETAAGENQFSVLAVHDLKAKMNAKGVAFAPQCQVVEVCNPVQAGQALTADLSISTVLPCRISVYQEAGKVRVSTIKPTALLAMFNRPDLQRVAQDVERTILRIVDAACD